MNLFFLVLGQAKYYDPRGGLKNTINDLKNEKNTNTNLINEIHMLNRNVICGVKYGRFRTFDPRRPSLILR